MLSTSIQKHYYLPRTVALEMMNNNYHDVSAIVSSRLVGNSVGGGCSLGDGQNLQVDCWSSYDFNCLGVGWSVELGSGGRVVVDVLSWS